MFSKKTERAYGRLTKLLTTGNRRAPKGACYLEFEDLSVLGADQIFIPMPPYAFDDHFTEAFAQLSAQFPGAVYLALKASYRGNDRARFCSARIAFSKGKNAISGGQ